MENVRAHREIKFILSHQWTQAVKDASGPRFRSARIIVPDKMMLLEKARTSVVANRPIFVGQAVLDLSKLIMYRAFYTVYKAQFGDRVRLCYTDTDSFVMLLAGLKGKTIAEEKREMHAAHDIYDLSEIEDPQNNPLTRGMTTEELMKNKKRLHRIKSETQGIPILEAVFLRSKTYSILLSRPMTVKHHNKKKAAAGKRVLKDHIAKKKGIPKKLPADQDRLLFGHESYRDMYFQGGRGGKVTFPTISHTKKLALYTGVMVKAGLSNLDDKNYWINPATCMRYGHWRIRRYTKKLAKQFISHAEMVIEAKMLQEWEDDARQYAEMMSHEARILSEIAQRDRELFLAECSSLPDEKVATCLEELEADSDNRQAATPPMEVLFGLSEPSAESLLEDLYDETFRRF